MQDVAIPQARLSSSGPFTLGTAQLGLPNYGRANTTGRPERGEAIALVSKAVERGIDCIDTARGYQLAEAVVGEALKPFGDRVRVVTKLDPLEELPANAPPAQVRQAVDASVFRSCRELGRAALPILLLHRWQHRTSHQGLVWQRLIELRGDGAIGQLGTSVSTPAEALAALGDPEIRQLQLPFNLLDHRWRMAGIDRRAVERSDVVIHARSALLQGLLAAPPSVWPRLPGVSAEKTVAQLEQLALRLGRANRLDLSLSFVRAQPWIHSLVLGVETVAQLVDLLRWFERPPLSAAECAEVWQSISEVPEILLNPALWPGK